MLIGLGRGLGVILLALLALRTARSGHQAFVTGHYVYAVDTDDDCGHREHVEYRYDGNRARTIGAGLHAVALGLSLWIVPLLLPGFWSSPLRRTRFLRLSLGACGAALLLIWPPWRISDSGVAAMLWFFLAVFGAWRYGVRGVCGKRREQYRGLALLLTFIPANVLGVVFFGTDSMVSVWVGAFLASAILLHLSVLRSLGWPSRRSHPKAEPPTRG